MPDAPLPIKATPASADQKAWHEYRRASQQEEPKRLEEAAKFLAGMVSITFTILLSADKEVLRGQAPLLQAVASLCWLIALLLAFLVLYPKPYRYAQASAQSIEQMHRRVVRWKARVLAAAVVFFLLGFLLLAGVYVWAVLGAGTA
jgi:predicted histidine transporter YuiF (NhaC family)